MFARDRPAFPRGSEFKIVTGRHGSSLGELGGNDKILLKQLNRALKLMSKKVGDAITEMGYTGLDRAEDIGNAQQDATDLSSAYREEKFFC